MKPIRFAIIDCNPVSVEFGRGIWTTWVKWSLLRLGDLCSLPVQLRGRSLIKTNAFLHWKDAITLNHHNGANRIRICGVLGGFKTHLDMALRRQVVNFIGLHFLTDTDEICRIGKAAVV